MNDPVPIEVWRDLYRIAATLRRMEPWNWMPNGVCFALRMKSGSDETRLVAVLKQPDRFPIISLLPDWRSAYLISRMGGDAPFYDPVNIPQTNVLFGPDTLLAQRDRDVMAMLGVEQSKTDAPLFRALRDGRAPWFFTKDEAIDFRDALNQLLGVALRSEEDQEMLRPRHPEGVFARVKGADGKWDDARIVPPPPPSRTPVPKPDPAKVEKVRAAAHDLGVVEADVRATPLSMNSPGNGPTPAFQFLVVNAETRHIVISALIVPNNGVMAMWNAIPGILMDACLKIDGFPREIKVANPRLQAILHALTEHVRFRLTRVAKLEAVEQVAGEALKVLLAKTVKKPQPPPAPPPQ